MQQSLHHSVGRRFFAACCWMPSPTVVKLDHHPPRRDPPRSPDTVLRLAGQVLNDARPDPQNSMSNSSRPTAPGCWASAKAAPRNPTRFRRTLPPGQPRPRSCPSRKFPCKHGVALMLLYAQDAGKFAPVSPTSAAGQTGRPCPPRKATGDLPKKVTPPPWPEGQSLRDGLDLESSWSTWWRPPVVRRPRLERLGRQQKQLTTRS